MLRKEAFKIITRPLNEISRIGKPIEPMETAPGFGERRQEKVVAVEYGAFLRDDENVLN